MYGKCHRRILEGPVPEDDIDGYLTMDFKSRAEIARVITEFEKDLRFLGPRGRIRSCELVVDVTMGRVNSNHSYGAICDIAYRRHSAPFLICTDIMVGHFALKSGFSYSRDDVARFTREDCTEADAGLEALGLGGRI